MKFKRESKGKPMNKMLLSGIIMIVLGIVIAGAYFILLPSDEPAGKFTLEGTGIKETLTIKKDVLYYDNSFEEETMEKINQFSQIYGVQSVNTLTDNTEISNSIIISKKENTNLLIVEKTIGWTYGPADTLVLVDDKTKNLYIIGTDRSILYTLEILQNPECKIFDKPAVVIKIGLGCEGIIDYVVCRIE